MLPARTALSILPRVSRLSSRPVIARAYHEKVISHYERPRNVSRITTVSAYVPFLEFPFVYLIIWAQVGSLPKHDNDVGTGLVGAPAYVVTPSIRPTCGLG